MQPRRHQSPEQSSLEIWCEKDKPTAAYSPRNWETICNLNIKTGGLSKCSNLQRGFDLLIWPDFLLNFPIFFWKFFRKKKQFCLKGGFDLTTRILSGTPLILDYMSNPSEIQEYKRPTSTLCPGILIKLPYCTSCSFAWCQLLAWSMVQMLASVFYCDLCKQLGPESSPTFCWAWSKSKLFDTLMVFLKEFFKKVDSEKNQQTTNIHIHFPSCKVLSILIMHNILLVAIMSVHQSGGLTWHSKN